MKKQIGTISLALSGLLISIAGCTSTNPYDHPAAYNKVSTASATGAASAAFTGKSLSNPPGLAISGATGNAHPASGTALAYPSKPPQGEMTMTTLKHGVTLVQFQGNKDLYFLMPANVHFAKGQSQLNPAFTAALNSVVSVMKKYPYTIAEIPGHTDSTGSDYQNLVLSQARANAVANYIASQGISPHRLKTLPQGESIPVASNETKQGQALNRRVEIILHTPYYHF